MAQRPFTRPFGSLSGNVCHGHSQLLQLFPHSGRASRRDAGAFCGAGELWPPLRCGGGGGGGSWDCTCVTKGNEREKKKKKTNSNSNNPICIRMRKHDTWCVMQSTPTTQHHRLPDVRVLAPLARYLALKVPFSTRGRPRESIGSLLPTRSLSWQSGKSKCIKRQCQSHVG